MIDFRKIEEKWRKKWEEAKIFEVEPDDTKDKFYITVAYPYPSGGMHVGHVRTYTVPDTIARFKRMQGYNVLFPMAWHVTGTPIIGALKRLKEGEEKQLHVLKNVYHMSDEEIRSIQTPMDYARYFIENHYYIAMKSLGYSIDWRRQFTTNDLHYRKFIEWQHTILYKKGLEKKGKHPVKWCVKDKNPVTTHDLLEGEDADILEFTLLKFKFGRDYLVAATLRPETIFGQTNLWVNPDVTYVRVSINNEKWIISRECAEKLSYQDKKIKILNEVVGRDIIGKYCEAPGIEKEIIILPAEFCDPNIGTGIVTSVPSDAPYDWIALQELKSNKELCKRYGLDPKIIEKIEPIPIIKTNLGELSAVEMCKKMNIKSIKERDKLEEATKLVYKSGFHTGIMLDNCGRYSGMRVEKAKELVREDLIKHKKADLMYDFSEPVKCRCGGKVVVAKKESWFIEYKNKQWKNLARKCVERMKMIPEDIRNEFFKTIEWLEDWPCVRNYGLGTPLPHDNVFIIEPLSDSTIYMAYYLISHIIKNYKPEQLTHEFFDYVMLGKGDLKSLEKKTGISKKDLERMRKSVKYWYPLDWRCSALELIQNHLTFMIFHHTAIFPEKMWPKGIATWGMGLLEGGKMSSSKGNVVLALDAVRSYGADVTRFFLLSSSEPWQDFDWRATELDATKNRLERFCEKILDLYNKGEKTEMRLIDRWMLSKLNEVIQNTTQALESFQTRKACLECFFKMNSLIKWYERRAGKPNVEVMRKVLLDWIKLLSPFIPHITEELWEVLGNKGFISLEPWPKVDKKLMNERIEKMEELIESTLEDIRSILKILKKKPKKIIIYVSPIWKYVVYESILKNVKSPNEVIPFVMKSPEGKKHGKEALKFAQNLAKNLENLKTILTEEEEYYALMDAREFFEREFGCKVEVIKAHTIRTEKALKAEPGKPGIEILA